MLPVPIQTDLFGGPNHIPGFHVVSAHFRVQPDGNEVFVAEHLRQSRGGAATTRPGHRASAEVADGQLGLFAGPAVGDSAGRG